MKKVKVYEVAKYIESETKGKYTAYSLEKFMTILQGKTETIAIDIEGVLWKYPNKGMIEFDGILNDGKFYPSFKKRFEYSIDEVLEKVKHTEMYLTDFIYRHDYNCRLQGNYLGVLESITEIGLDPIEYDSREIAESEKKKEGEHPIRHVFTQKLQDVLRTENNGKYKMYGSFYAKESGEPLGDRWVAISNLTGDAWTEDFATEEHAIRYLKGESKEEIEHSDNNGKICPICQKKYYDYPALSREDNKTEICPDCGMNEALGGVREC